jgi:hypothetical protein
MRLYMFTHDLGYFSHFLLYLKIIHIGSYVICVTEVYVNKHSIEICD